MGHAVDGQRRHYRLLPGARVSACSCAAAGDSCVCTLFVRLVVRATCGCGVLSVWQACMCQLHVVSLSALSWGMTRTNSPADAGSHAESRSHAAAAAASACCCRVRSVFWANMSVGETVLRTAPITPELPLSVYQDTEPTLDGQSLPQVQVQQLTAVPQLLCTGEVEDVRGDAGTFPQSLAPLEAQGEIYHPRGMCCVGVAVAVHASRPPQTLTIVGGRT